jgi:hypothetical protein
MDWFDRKSTAFSADDSELLALFQAERVSMDWFRA